MVRTQKVKWAVSGRAKDSRRPLRLRSFSPPDFAPIRRHPQQPRGSKRMLAVCRAGSKVTEVLAQYAGLTKSHYKRAPLWSRLSSLRTTTYERSTLNDR